MSTPTFAVVEALGCRVIEVKDLPRPILYIREHDIALVNAELSEESLDTAVDWLLSRAAAPGASTTYGNAVRDLRVLAGLTVEQVADEAGVPASRLRLVENGDVIATPKWLGLVVGVVAAHLG